jgi:putative transposase
MPDEPPGWHSRGYLPHYDDGAALQAITYRLWDALPADVVAKLEEQALDDAKRRVALERYLDAGHGSCALLRHGNAKIVVDGWRHFEEERYRLHAWVVMPNHVHVLLGPLVGHTIPEIMQAQKSFTAKAILAGSAGLRPAMQKNAGGTPALPGRHVWQPDYYDRFIRNERHYAAAVDYIHQNPVKAGLVARAEDWPWSSARDWERGRLARS